MQQLDKLSSKKKKKEDVFKATAECGQAVLFLENTTILDKLESTMNNLTNNVKNTVLLLFFLL